MVLFYFLNEWNERKITGLVNRRRISNNIYLLNENFDLSYYKQQISTLLYVTRLRLKIQSPKTISMNHTGQTVKLSVKQIKYLIKVNNLLLLQFCAKKGALDLSYLLLIT